MDREKRYVSYIIGRNKKQQEELLTLARPNRLEEELGMQGVEGRMGTLAVKSSRSSLRQRQKRMFREPEHVQMLRGKSQ